MEEMYDDMYGNKSLAWRNQKNRSKPMLVSKTIKRQSLKNIGLLILINILILICFLFVYSRM